MLGMIPERLDRIGPGASFCAAESTAGSRHHRIFFAMSNRETFHLSDFAKIVLIIAVLTTAGATHLYENRGVSRIGNVTANEMTDTLEWLDQFYASPEGLQRPEGLVKNGHIDFDGISHWLFHIYLQERSLEANPWTARASVEKAIRGTAEWQEKHR
jgi:hypothetical protein